MNRDTTKNRLKYWHIGIIFYMLVFLAGIGTLANILSTKAAPSSYFVTAEETPTPKPTPKPTATPGPTPTETPPTPTPVPTETPPTPTPTVTPPTPTPTDMPPTPTPTDMSPTPTPSAVTTPTVTPTSTAVLILPSKVDGDPLQNTGQTQPGHPSSGSNGGGSNMFALSLAASTSAMLLLAGGLFWLYLRRNQQGVAALQKWKRPSTMTNKPWASSRNIAPSSLPGPALFTAPIPPIASPSHGTTNPLRIAKDSVPEANILPPITSLSPTDPAELAYRPGDLRPMTMALPKQIVKQQAPDPMPFPATSNMNPLPLDTLDLAYGTEPMEPKHLTSEPPTIPEEPVSMPERNSSATTMPENSFMPVTTDTPSVQLPDVADDPILENVMRQAQLGLFVNPGNDKS